MGKGRLYTLASSLNSPSRRRGPELASAIWDCIGDDATTAGDRMITDYDDLDTYISGLPAVGFRRMVTLITRFNSMDMNQLSCVGDLLYWYADFWETFATFTASQSWRASLIGSLAAYGSSRRHADYSPYGQPLQVPAERFAQWRHEIVTGERDPRSSGNWRQPVGLFSNLSNYALFSLDLPTVHDAVQDRCSCGSTARLLLGDTGNHNFNVALCSICVGATDRGCGEIVVDVRD